MSVPVPASVAAPDITPMRKKTAGRYQLRRSLFLSLLSHCSIFDLILSKGEICSSALRVIGKMTTDAAESQTLSEYDTSEKRQIPKRYYSPQPQEKSDNYDGKVESVIKVAFSEGCKTYFKSLQNLI